MSKDTSKLGEIISQLSGKSFDLAVNEPETYAVKLLELEREAKADLLAWHREECERILPDKQTELEGIESKASYYNDGFNHAIDKIRVSLEAEDE